jgi:membrane fusion protein (multidrug efflux system)
MLPCYPRTLLAVALSAGALLTACGGPPPAPQLPPPPQVDIVVVQPTTADLGTEVPGRVEAWREVEVRARVRGILEQRLYSEGETVRAGQPLFRIDPTEHAVAVRAAEARAAEAEARRNQAARERDRLQPLVERRAASRKSLDDAESAVELAEADVLSARAALDRAQLELSWTRVAAPIAGQVGRAIPSEGALVEPGANGLLTHIVKVDPIWVRFSLPAEELARVRAELGSQSVQGLRVEIRRGDGDGRPLIGTVDFVDVQVTDTTGTVALRAELPNPTGALVPGEFVRVWLVGVTREEAIVVPQRAVQQGREGRFVYVVERGEQGEVAVRRTVELGPWVGSDWLVESGVEAGDRVVVDGIQRVQPGAPVTVTEGGPPSSGAPSSGPPSGGAEEAPAPTEPAARTPDEPADGSEQ